jgi:hypothetical protein
VSNQTLDLRSLVGIGYNYRGYVVESVSVEVGAINADTRLRLLVNGNIEDVVYVPNTYVTLYPRYGMQLDDEIRTLGLQVEGTALINAVHVRLRPAAYTGDWNQYNIDLDVYQRLNDYDVLDLNQQIDLNQYRGNRLISIDVEVESFYSTAALSLLVDGMIYGEVQVDAARKVVTIFPTNSLIVGDANDLQLYLNSGNGSVVDITGVTLRLSPY